MESNFYEECYATYLLYAAILCAYSNRYGEGERERELSSARSGVVKENTTVGYSATDVLFQGEHTFPRRSFIVARLPPMGRDRTSFCTIMIPNNTIEDLVLTIDMLLGYTSPLVSRPMFFVAPEDLYSPMAEHITTDIKEVPSDALLPLKIEVQQHGLTDQPVVNIRDVNSTIAKEGCSSLAKREPK